MGRGACRPQYVGPQRAELLTTGKKARQDPGQDFPRWPSGYDSAFQCRGCGLDPWSRGLRSHTPCNGKTKKQRTEAIS